MAATLLLLEVGIRTYYGVAGVSPVAAAATSDDEWRERWLARHRGDDPNTTDGIDRYHPRFGWSMNPNLKRHRVGDHPPVSTNAQGWRALRDYTSEKPPGVRIVVLGDSFTFGEGKQDEEVWPVQLERQLDGTEVLNFGVRGYGTDQQLLVLEEEALKYRPDVVVLGFFLEDIVRNALTFRDYAKPMFVLRDGELVLTNIPVPTPEDVLAQDGGRRPASYLLQLLRARWRSPAESVNLPRDEYKVYLSRLTNAILARMMRVTTAAGAKLMVVIIPSPRSVGDTEAMLVRWAPEIGYAVVNARPALLAAERVVGEPIFEGFYLSAFGDLVLASVVRQALVENGFVPSPAAERLEYLDPRIRHLARARP